MEFEEYLEKSGIDDIEVEYKQKFGLETPVGLISLYAEDFREEDYSSPKDLVDDIAEGLADNVYEAIKYEAKHGLDERKLDFTCYKDGKVVECPIDL